MKTLLGLLTVIAALSAAAAGIAILLTRYGAELAASTGSGFVNGVIVASLGLASMTGLTAAIVAALGGFLFLVVHLACKSWLWALFSALVSAAGFGLWFLLVFSSAA